MIIAIVSCFGQFEEKTRQQDVTNMIFTLGGRFARPEHAKPVLHGPFSDANGTCMVIQNLAISCRAFRLVFFLALLQLQK